MAIFHMSAKAVSRSGGRSATGAAAYRAGEKIEDQRTGQVFDYSRKSGIASADLLMPEGPSAEGRAEFWNRVELHHKRGDATTAREVEVALPTDLPPEARHGLALILGQQLASHYGVAADVAVHEKAGNPHAHILLSACSVGPGGALGKKVAELDPIHCQRHRLENLAERFRPAWESIVNAALEGAALEARVDHRTLEAQGIDRAPGFHLGPNVLGFERRTGQRSDRRQEMEERAEEVQKAARAKEEQEKELRQIRKLVKDLEDLRIWRLELRSRAQEKQELKRLYAQIRDVGRAPNLRDYRAEALRLAEQEVDRNAVENGKPPPFKTARAAEAAANKRRRALEQRGRPDGIWARITGKSRAWDAAMASAVTACTKTLARVDRMDFWLTENHPALIKKFQEKLAQPDQWKYQARVDRVASVQARMAQIEARVATITAGLSQTGPKVQAALDKVQQARTGPNAGTLSVQALIHRLQALAAEEMEVAKRTARNEADLVKNAPAPSGPGMS